MAVTAFSFARMANQYVLENVSHVQLDLIPEGFNNSIRWNFGHVLVIAERILSFSEHYQAVLPDHYINLFNMGTSPKDWTGDVPSTEELVEMSNKQKESITALYEAHGSSVLAKPFKLRGTKFNTINELLSFLSFHEGSHYEKSKILALLKKNPNTVSN